MMRQGKPTAAGNIRFTADRGENGHSDRFWAGALALHAKGGNDGPCRMEALNVQTDHDNYHRPDHSDDWR